LKHDLRDRAESHHEHLSREAELYDPVPHYHGYHEDDYEHAAEDFHHAYEDHFDDHHSNAFKPQKKTSKRTAEKKAPTKQQARKPEPEKVVESEPSICFVKAYARKPVGTPQTNLVPVRDSRQNAIDWSDAYFYNMMETPHAQDPEMWTSDEEYDSESYYSDEGNSSWGSSEADSMGNYYDDDSDMSNDLGFDSSEEYMYEHGYAHYDNSDGEWGFSEEDNEVFDSDENAYPVHRRRRTDRERRAYGHRAPVYGHQRPRHGEAQAQRRRRSK
jgi:hypothetical protein